MVFALRLRSVFRRPFIFYDGQTIVWLPVLYCILTLLRRCWQQVVIFLPEFFILLFNWSFPALHDQCNLIKCLYTAFPVLLKSATCVETVHIFKGIMLQEGRFDARQSLFGVLKHGSCISPQAAELIDGQPT